MLYALSISFASVDWVMSLDPHWGSTIYGLIFLAGQGLSALCFCIIILTVLTRYRPYSEIIKPTQFHDLGKLTLAFVMLFAYFSFSQWLIIWSGNLPDEISWYLHRIRGGWGYIILAIVAFHFALPFALLLSRERKRAGRRLIGLAIVHHVHAPGGHLLVRRAELPGREAVQHLVSGGADRPRRFLAGGRSSTTSGSGRCCRFTSRRSKTSCTKDRDMATNDTHYDPLRNPQVDYERSDLSARGILWFLVGLFVAGFFIELVLWGMFHFMARTEALFPQPQVNPMLQAEQATESAAGHRHAFGPAEFAGGEPQCLSRAAPADERRGRDEAVRRLRAGVAECEAAVRRSERSDSYSDFAGDAGDCGAGIAGAAQCASAGDQYANCRRQYEDAGYAARPAGTSGSGRQYE